MFARNPLRNEKILSLGNAVVFRAAPYGSPSGNMLLLIPNATPPQIYSCREVIQREAQGVQATGW